MYLLIVPVEAVCFEVCKCVCVLVGSFNSVLKCERKCGVCLCMYLLVMPVEAVCFEVCSCSSVTLVLCELLMLLHHLLNLQVCAHHMLHHLIHCVSQQLSYLNTHTV